MNWNKQLDLRPCCQNLRHKLMYCDPRQETPGLVDNTSDTRVFLCVLTQEVLGPDGAPVGPAHCSPSRPCHRASLAAARPAPEQTSKA